MRLTIRKISMLLVLILAGLVLNTSVSSAGTATVEINGENRYKSLRLLPTIYNAAGYDLSDLLLKDSNGENVPYFINSGSKSQSTNRVSYQMALINAYLKNDYFYFDYSLAGAPTGDIIATSIEFSTNNTGFAKGVDIYGSYDNTHWERIQRDTLYSIDGKSKLEIKFQGPQKFTHYRLELANNLEQISFDTVNLVYSIETNEETYFIEALDPEFTVEHGNKETLIKISGLKNLRLCDITIHTDSMFKRDAVTTHGKSKELYNLSFNDTSYSDTTIPLDWYIPTDDLYCVAIADADDKPIDISGITVRYYVDEVVFEGIAGEAYTLEFGSEDVGAAPEYDIKRYKNEILQGAVDRAVIRGIHFERTAEAPERDYRLFFNIVMVVVTLLLGVVIVQKLKKK